VSQIVLLPVHADRHRAKLRARRINAAAVAAQLAFVVCYEAIAWLPRYQWVDASHGAAGKVIDVVIGIAGVSFAWGAARRSWWMLAVASAWDALWMLFQFTPWWAPHLGPISADRRLVYGVAHLGFALVTAGTLVATLRAAKLARDERQSPKQGRQETTKERAIVDAD
jgi:hypothetical protein